MYFEIEPGSIKVVIEVPIDRLADESNKPHFGGFNARSFVEKVERCFP